MVLLITQLKCSIYIELYSGTIREGDRAFIGPDENCEYREIHITSIQRYRLPCRLVKAGQTATLAINGIDKFAIRKVL